MLTQESTRSLWLILGLPWTCLHLVKLRIDIRKMHVTLGFSYFLSTHLDVYFKKAILCEHEMKLRTWHLYAKSLNKIFFEGHLIGGWQHASHWSSTRGSEGTFFSFKAKSFQHPRWQFWQNCQKAPSDMDAALWLLHLSFLFIKKQNRKHQENSQDCVFSYKKIKDFFLPDDT